MTISTSVAPKCLSKYTTPLSPNSLIVPAKNILVVSVGMKLYSEFLKKDVSWSSFQRLLKDCTFTFAMIYYLLHCNVERKEEKTFLFFNQSLEMLCCPFFFVIFTWTQHWKCNNILVFNVASQFFVFILGHALYNSYWI